MNTTLAKIFDDIYYNNKNVPSTMKTANKFFSGPYYDSLYYTKNIITEKDGNTTTCYIPYPGLSKDSLSIEFSREEDNNYINIKIDCEKSKYKSFAETYYKLQSKYLDKISVPENINEDSIDVTYNDGILIIKFSTDENKIRRPIAIK